MFKNNRLIQTINKYDVFSPYIFFPSIMMIYFFFSLFDFGRVELFDAKKNIIPVILVGLAAYYAAVFIVTKLGWTFPTFGLGFLKGKTIWFLYLLGIIGLVSYLIMLFTGQIGIADESIRRNLDPKLNFLSTFLWFAVIFIISYRIIKEGQFKKTYIVLLLLIFGAFMLMGYRTAIAIMFFTSMLIFHYMVRRISTSWLIMFMTVIFVSFSLFGLFRVLTEDTSKPFNDREGPQVELTEEKEDRMLQLRREVNKTPKAIRALTETMVTGRIVVSKIMEYTEDYGYLKGELHTGIFSTVLPGEQISPRMMITDAVNSYAIKDGNYITRPGRTTTPTILGQLFIEGGYLTVILGLAFYGAVLTMLYNRMMKTGTKSYQTIAYGFVMTIFMISIHTGLLDLVFLIMIVYAIVSTSIEQNRKWQNP
jgi:hypothetical protein